MDELEEAIDRASMGLERKSRVMSEKEKIRVASHEMGHALVAHYSSNIDPVHRVTIIPRGTAALGLTMTRPLEDRYLATEPELTDMLAFAMGGRVAEEICFGEISTGAQNDLEKATQVARAMVAEYGMSEKVGPLTAIPADGVSPLLPGADGVSERTQELVDEETRAIVEEAHDEVHQLLLENRSRLDALAQALLANETLDEAEAYAAAGVAAVPAPVPLS
jgi:cell division protease FtsH